MPDSGEALLSEIHTALKGRRRLFLISGDLYLTKTMKQRSEAWVVRDTSTEWKVRALLERGNLYLNIIEKYRDLDSGMRLAYPAHVPVRVVAGHGALCSGTNVFLFFPQAAGHNLGNSNDQFSLELIDVMEAMFERSIFPCVRRIFDFETQFWIFSSLHGRVAEVNYLCSFFHEVGHRTGPLSVSPRNPRMKAEGFEFDAVGELSTEALLAKNLSGFPEAALWSTLQRLIHYARIGFSQDPQSGRLNDDNDSWTGAYLWQKLRSTNALRKNGSMWSLDREGLEASWGQVLEEVQAVARAALDKGESEEQKMHLRSWMREQVPCNEEAGRFVYPDDMRQSFHMCQGVAEVPPFVPPMTVPTDVLSRLGASSAFPAAPSPIHSGAEDFGKGSLLIERPDWLIV